MATRFYVPKFITIEDKLAGLLTFRQLFALLGAFLLSFLVFRINQFLGFITMIISFGTAFLLTFVHLNGKPFVYILPQVFGFVFGSKRFVWQKIEKVTYKEVALSPEITDRVPYPKIKERKKNIGDKAEIILEYPETNIKEKLSVSLKEPIALQAEEINRYVHRHLSNPKNPYRFFPYVKFYRTIK
ncbi:MAG: hypothetical protein KatS3mg096_062 [Candidatus Parcubacteria bacterium]|nr:MAG: hypothetical protein KatS3mg096_062 [Candidatus Parcubacteria bacterium]